MLNRLLSIQLVPETSWYDNVRSRVSRDKWIAIRAYFKKPSCQYCGYKGNLFTHEVWKYDDKRCTQKLVGFEAVCFLCHSVHHFGLAGIMARRGDLDMNELIRHYCVVNGCTKEDFELDKKEAFELWEERSKHDWSVDISYLDSLGIVSIREWMRKHPSEVQHLKNSYSDDLD